MFNRTPAPGRPTLGQSFQNFVAVEEVGTAKLKSRAQAQALARQASSSSATPADPPPLWGIGPGAEASAAGDGNERQADIAASRPASGLATRPVPPPPVLRAPAAHPYSHLDWESDGEEEGSWLDFGSDTGAGWPDNGTSIHSLDGRSGTAAGSVLGRLDDGGSGVSDLSGVNNPTVRLALALGLDPLRLPLFGGAGSHTGSPAAAIKALRAALARPAVSPCMEALLTRQTTGSHLRMTKSVLAKQRLRAGAEGGQAGGLEGRLGRVQTIDALLMAMQRRLGAVKAAMAADAARQIEQVARGQPEAGGKSAAEAQQPAAAAAAAGGPPSPGSTPCSGSSPRARLPGRGQQHSSPLFARKLLAEAAEGVLGAQQQAA